MACLDLFLDSSYINPYNILTNANLIVPLTEQIFSSLRNCTSTMASLFPIYSIFYGPSIIFSAIVTGVTTPSDITNWLNTIINGFKTQMAVALLGL
jgi:hypothetical protein